MLQRQKSKAVALMLLSSLCFSVMQIFVKLSAGEIGTFEQTFFRNLVSLFIALWMARRAKLNIRKEFQNGKWAIWARSVFGFLGVVLLFYATANARQMDVAMLNKSAPVFVTLVAALLLKEKLNFVKIASVAICLVGAYVAMQPSFDSNPLPLLAALATAMVSGVAYTMVARCKDLMHPAAVVLHFSVFSTVCSVILMLPAFVLPSPGALLLLVCIGVFAAGGQLFLTYAYQLAPATEVSIYQYSGVVFNAVLGGLVLGEELTARSVLGAFIILGAISWVFVYNRRQARLEAGRRADPDFSPDLSDRKTKKTS